MSKLDDMSFPKMKADIAKAGNLFYQYRACRRDAAIIYDIENIRHGVVYARTPLQMNDPFDSMIGFSVEEVYDECIDLVLNQVDYPLNSNLKLIIKYLLKYRIIGKTLDFINALNKLGKFIFTQTKIAHVSAVNLPQFIAQNLDRLYSKCSAEIKKCFSKEAFLVFALIIKDYHNEEIDEQTIVKAFEMEDILRKLEVLAGKTRDEIYIPFIKDFLSKLTVTCFSASGWDNHLMWSHYSNSYSGICVEYDFDKMNQFIGFMYPVKYSNIRPIVSLKDLGITDLKKDENGNFITEEVNMDKIFSYLLTKNKCWSYEEEWRIINLGDKPYTPMFVNAPFVKSITLGLDLDEMCKQLLWDVCQERNIECYQLVINSSDYNLERELLTADSFVFSKEKSEQYIKLIAEHTVSLCEKISTNYNSLTMAVNEGDFEPISMINVLTFTLDYLSDVYFLKCEFNKFCKFVNTSIAEVTNNAQICTAINQIDAFILQLKASVKFIEDSLLTLRIMNKITSNDIGTAKKLVANIQELIKKHYELNWYSKEVEET